MQLCIEPSSSTPITRQMMEQIRALCASGQLQLGERLPSVRALAAELAVNQNTVLRVYERLTAEGLLDRRHGDGTYVTSSLPTGQLRIQRDYIRQELRRLIQQARMAGMKDEDIHKTINESLQEKT